MANIGAFVSTAGGLSKTLERAAALGVDSVMIFASSPQSWNRRVFLESDLQDFWTSFRQAGYDSLWIHGTYLMNFGSVNPDALQKSTETLVLEVEDAARLGARGVIFHLGSYASRSFELVFDQIVTALGEVLRRTAGGPAIILENSAGMGGSIGSKFTELGQLVHKLNDPRIQICLDTQHAFAAGYPVHTKEGLTEVLADFDREIGLERLVVLHANDSKVAFAGGRDRHENIGDGFIGDAGFRVMTHHPFLQKLPFLLEVPGFDGHGPDKPNVDHLRIIAERSIES